MQENRNVYIVKFEKMEYRTTYKGKLESVDPKPNTMIILSIEKLALLKHKMWCKTIAMEER